LTKGGNPEIAFNTMGKTKRGFYSKKQIPFMGNILSYFTFVILLYAALYLIKQRSGTK
jgi:hypothetical protein